MNFNIYITSGNATGWGMTTSKGRLSFGGVPYTFEITRTDIRIDQVPITKLMRETVKLREVQRWNKKRRNKR